MKTATQTGTQITPGPWKVWRSIVDGSVNVANHAGEYVALVGRTNGAVDDQRIESDARLIAAVPELLAALKTILADHESCVADEQPGFLTEIQERSTRAAIAKAEGVS